MRVCIPLMVVSAGMRHPFFTCPFQSPKNPLHAAYLSANVETQGENAGTGNKSKKHHCSSAAKSRNIFGVKGCESESDALPADRGYVDGLQRQ